MGRGRWTGSPGGEFLSCRRLGGGLVGSGGAEVNGRGGRMVEEGRCGWGRIVGRKLVSVEEGFVRGGWMGWKWFVMRGVCEVVGA